MLLRRTLCAGGSALGIYTGGRLRCQAQEGVCVEPLAHRPRLIPQVASWQEGAFGQDRPGTDFISRLKGRVRVDALPTTIVALRGGEPLGCASVIESDPVGKYALARARDPGGQATLSGMAALEATAWLVTLYVVPDSRKQGIGPALIASAVAQARYLGFPSLYLCCEGGEAGALARYYSRHGFAHFCDLRYRGKSLAVMVAATACAIPTGETLVAQDQTGQCR